MTEEHGLSREQVEALGKAVQRDRRHPAAPTALESTVAAMLADAEKRGEDRGRAEGWDRGYASGHSRAMRRMSDEPNVADGENPYRHTASAAQEGTTEPLGAAGSAGGPESPRASDGHTGPIYTGYDPTAYNDGADTEDPTCGERHEDMRCQLRRGHDGAHEDYSGMVR